MWSDTERLRACTHTPLVPSQVPLAADLCESLCSCEVGAIGPTHDLIRHAEHHRGWGEGKEGEAGAGEKGTVATKQQRR